MTIDEQDDGRCLRVMVFPDRPDCILFYVPDGMRLIIPPIPSPFYKTTTSAALSSAGLNYRLTESVPGRWTESVLLMKKAERAERAQLQKVREATMAVLDRSGGPLAQNRAEAISKKHEVDERIREAKAWIGRAKSNSFARGTYEDPDRYRRKERELYELQQESLALQARLGELKKLEKAENRAAAKDENERFVKAAYRVLSQEKLDLILDAVADDLDAEDEAGARP